MLVIDIISLILVIIGIGLFIFSTISSKFNTNLPKVTKNKNPHFCILIPARDESKVIEGLLKSIRQQTYQVPMEDVYVIVEDKTDETVSITKEYKATVLFREDLSLKRKGYALDEAIHQILALNKHYDAYFILDADNILDSHFIEEMKKTYQKGYDMAAGYRNCKNGNYLLAATASLTYSILNTLINESRIKYAGNIIMTGTGCYIKGDLIEKWQGYPFHSLTEDYESTLYGVLHGLTSCYNPKAMFYDEQPITYHQSRIQRTRWIKGFFEARRIYIKPIRRSLNQTSKNKGSRIAETVGISPYLIAIIGIVLYLFSHVIATIVKTKELMIPTIGQVFGVIGIVYFVLLIITALILLKERGKINLSTSMKWKVLLVHPFFLVTYIPCFVRALISKDMSWERIEHHIVEVGK